MDKAKIAKLCNEIEDIATDIQERPMKNSYYMAQTIINKVLVIGAEISAQPKTNADRIRQMTDEELVMALETDCNRCAESENCELRGDPVDYGDCVKGNVAWLKQEVSEDAGTVSD